MLIAVTIYFWGDSLNPESITSALALQPSKAHLKGERSITATNKEVIAKTGMWSLASDQDLKSAVLDEHISHLQTKFGDKWKTLGAISNDAQDACIDIYVGVSEQEKDTSAAYFELSHEGLDTLLATKLPVRFTVTFPTS